MPEKKATRKRRRAAPFWTAVQNVMGHIARLLVTLFLIGVITGCVVVTAITIYVMNFMETDAGINLDNVSLAQSTIFYAPNSEGNMEEVYRMSANENHIEVSLDQIPQHVQDAFVYTEDKRFYEHDGVDWIRTIKVTAEYLLKQGTQGGSTITQQVVKNVSLDDDFTPVRKIREIFRAIQLERDYTKDEILEVYLNVIFMGGNNRGVEAAAQSYFGCHVWDLTVPQAASLAAMTQAPNYFRPDLYPERLMDRRVYTFDALLEAGKITQEEYDQYVDEPIVTVSKEDSQLDDQPTGQTAQGITSYYTDACIEEVISDLMEENNWSREHATDMIRRGGYRVYMNVDPNLQQIVEQKFLDPGTFSPNTLSPNANGELPEAAFVLMDYEGNVKALVGGKGEKTGSRTFNRATQAGRSPGSAIKPIAVYAPALEYDLINWSTVLVDGPVMENNGKPYPSNFSGKYEGDVTVVYALRKSLNTIPMKIIQQLTTQRSVDFMQKKLGITSLLTDGSDYGPSLSLGSNTNGFYLDELTAAYAPFGNGGYYYEPATYSVIEDSNGNIVYDNRSNKNRAISEDTASIMNRLLRQVVIGESGTGHKAAMGDMEVIGKTGTAQNYTDRLFVGMTPYYIGGFWTGYDTPSELPESQLYAPDQVWKNIMVDVHAGLEPRKFEISDQIVAIEFCTESGMAVGPNCTKTETGYYKENAKPDVCDYPHESESTEEGDGTGGGGSPQNAKPID
ncbi:MAG: transglycosylase domain-containing protein [Candidatus Merdivicinus sp.]